MGFYQDKKVGEQLEIIKDAVSLANKCRNHDLYRLAEVIISGVDETLSDLRNINRE